MPANTPRGFPYVLPEDHPLEYPPVTQNLATMLEAFHLTVDVAVKGSDQSGIASGGAAGFSASLSDVPAGVPVLGFISHVGSASAPGVQYLGPAWTGGAGEGSGPQFSAASGWFQLLYVGVCIATGGPLSLTYTMTTSGGATWTCHTRSTIVLATL